MVTLYTAAFTVWLILVADTIVLAQQATTPPVFPSSVVIIPTPPPTPAPRMVTPQPEPPLPAYISFDSRLKERP